MALTTEQKVDLLLKKLGYTKTKTGSVFGTGSVSGTGKQPFGEAIPSPLIVANGSLWNESDSIPATPPGSDTNQVKRYPTTSALRMTLDTTVTPNRSFIAYTTYNNTSSARLTNWIDTQFGPDYQLEVYVDDATDPANKLPEGGSGSNDGWYFDYSAGVLNFSDTNLPSGVNGAGTNVYIVGYRYVGQTGAPTPGISTYSFLDLTVERNLDVGKQGGISTFRNAINALDIIKGYKYTAAPYSGTTTTLTVTVASKVSGEHRYHGQGSGLGYVIDGLQSPFFTLTPGRTYRFDQSDNSNSNHQIKFYLESDKTTLYEEGVTYNGSAGTSGAYTQIVVSDKTPVVLHYQCVNHGYMGNAFQTNANVVNTNYEATIRGGLNVTGVTTHEGHVLPSVDATYDLGSPTKKWKDIYFHNLVTTPGGPGFYGDDIITRNLKVNGISTFTGDATFAGNVSIGGTLTYEDVTNVDSIGILTARSGIRVTGGVIEAQAGENKIPALYADLASLPSASTYHGMFAHVHATGRGYFSHAGNWLELVNKDTSGNVGLSGDLDVDGHTNLDNVSVAGVSTFASSIYVADSIIHEGDTDTKIDFAGNQVKITSGNKLLTNFNGNNGYSYLYGATNFESNSTSTKPSSYVARFRCNDGDDTEVQFFNTNVKNTILSWNDNGNTTAAGNLIFKGVVGASGVEHARFTGSGNFNLLRDLDVDGHTNLDNVSIAGVTTTAGLLDINAGGQANTFKVEDLTSGRVVLAGTGGELEDSNNLRFDGTDLYVSGIRIIGGIGGIIGPDIVTRNLQVNGISTHVGIATFNDATFHGDIDVDGHTNLDNVSVAGVSTFTGRVYSNGGLTVDQYLELSHYGGSNFIRPNNGALDIITGASTNIAKFQPGGGVDLYYNGTKRFETTNTGINVTGDTETDTLNTGNATFTGTISAGGATGTSGQYLKSTGSGVAWASFPTARSSQVFTASAGQTTFSFSYTVGLVDVFVNGIKLSNSEFTATNGTSIVLAVGSFVGDIVEILSYNVATGGGGGNLSNIVQDVTPQLGGNLDLNTKTINGTGGINITGVATATKFVGDGSGLTGVTASGSGVIVKDGGTLVGTAQTIDFGANLSLTPVSAGIVTVTASGGGSGITTAEVRANTLVVSGVSTFTGNVDANGDLDVDGHTNLDNVNIAGVTTFATTVNLNTSSDSGASRLLNIAHATSSSPLVRIANTHASGRQAQIEYQNTQTNFKQGIQQGSPYGFATFSINPRPISFWNSSTERLRVESNGNISIFKDLDVDGHTELDNVNIAGVVTATTFKGAVQATSGTFSSGVDVTGDLDVDGHTDLDNVSVAGVVTATTFVGALTGNVTGNITGNVSGSSGSCTGNSATATEATNVTVTANNSTNETVYPVFVDGATGTQGAETDTGLNYNPSTGNLSATKFTGDGSALTGISGSGGVTVQDEGSTLSTQASTLNFVGTGVVASGSGVTKTITINAGTADTTDVRTNTLEVVGVSTFAGITTVTGNTLFAKQVNVSGVSTFQNASSYQFTVGAGNLQVNGNSIYGSSKIIIMGGGGGDTQYYSGGTSYSDHIFKTLQGGSQIERFRIGKDGDIGLSGENYGTSGQVLTSGGSGSAASWTTISAGTNVGITTNISGTFTASAGSPSTINTFGYGSGDIVVEYTVFIKNGSNFQTQKLLAMRDGTTIHSTQFAVMFSSSLLVQLDATISGSNILLRATPETGISGSTTYKVKREVM